MICPYSEIEDYECHFCSEPCNFEEEEFNQDCLDADNREDERKLREIE